MATLLFDVGTPPTTELRFNFSLVVFQNPQRAGREITIGTARGEHIGCWTLTAPVGEWGIAVPVSAWAGSRLALRFSFDEPKSPRQLGLSADRRALSIKLRRLCITAT